MSNHKFNRRIGGFRAVLWLNSFCDAVESGVLTIGPGISEARAEEIARELNSFRDKQLPLLRKLLKGPADAYATVHLRRWAEDVAVGGMYPHTRLLQEQNQFRECADALRSAREMVRSGELGDEENQILLSLVLARAERSLVPFVMAPPKPEPGILGERVRDCEQGIEAVLNKLELLRLDDFTPDAAAELSETCMVLHERAFQLAKCVREEVVA